jgi:choline dehydrogenase
MAYCRGAPSVFDEWASTSGDDGLKWENLLTDFETTTHYDQDVYSYGDGPSEVSRQQMVDSFAPDPLQAMKMNLNLSEVDLNNGTGIGATYGVSSIRTSNRTRDYALEAYGWQVANRTNVKLIHSAWANKIGFNGKRATKITYFSTLDNETHVISFEELIVSAGAFGSPKLLMLSGVGPADHLQNLSIPVILDVPELGSNVYDHHSAVVEVEVTSDVETPYKMMYNAADAALVKAEYQQGKGPLGYRGAGSFAVSRVPDSVFEAVNDAFHPSLPADRGDLLYQYDVGALIQGGPNVSTVSGFVSLVQPEASGYMRLQSADYRDDPIIYSNYFGSAGDKAAILYRYKQLRSILSSEIMAPLVIREIFPGTNVTSDEDLWHAISQSARSFHHPLGTVALGKVVDSDWRIMGLESIRVVDSSMIPYPPTCHLQASTYAYAHCAARKIKDTDTHI